MLHVKFTSKPFDKVKSQCAVVTAFSDRLPFQGNAALLDWRLNGRLSQILIAHRFQGNFKETLLMPAEGRVKSETILVMGLGEKQNFGESHIATFTQYLLEVLEAKKVSDFMLSFSDMITDRFGWRNSIRLLVSKLHDYVDIDSVFLCETDDYVRDARRRHMDFGLNVDVSFETAAV